MLLLPSPPDPLVSTLMFLIGLLLVIMLNHILELFIGMHLSILLNGMLEDLLVFWICDDEFT